VISGLSYIQGSYLEPAQKYGEDPGFSAPGGISLDCRVYKGRYTEIFDAIDGRVFYEMYESSASCLYD
jgi:hypothetical protein